MWDWIVFVFAGSSRSLSEGTLLKTGCKWFNKLLSSFPLVSTAYFSGQSCPRFSSTFTVHMPIKLLPATFCQFTRIPHSKSVTQRWDIKSQCSQWGFFANQLKMSSLTARACRDTNSTKPFSRYSLCFSLVIKDSVWNPPLSSTLKLAVHYHRLI